MGHEISTLRRERNTFSASEELRQAFYCSFVLQSQDESGLHKRMIQSCREMSTAPEWAPSSSSSPFLSGFEAEKLKSSVGKALYVVVFSVRIAAFVR